MINKLIYVVMGFILLFIFFLITLAQKKEEKKYTKEEDYNCLLDLEKQFDDWEDDYY